jgi:protein SCO1/2
MTKVFGQAIRNLRPIGFLLLALLVVGCHSSSKHDAVTNATRSSGKQYSVRGKVVSVDAKDGVISLDTEAIPGFMEAMSMAYTLQNPSVASELHPGDKIMAQLQVGAQGAVLSDIVITQQAVLNAMPSVRYHIPQPGETVPDFKLLNQSGREIHLSQYRGKVLVLTFIYTRCLSPQFCPLMSLNFAKLEEMLAANPKLYAKSHLLSISFDPRYDTPRVLRSYGRAYMGHNTKQTFQHWDFAAPSSADLASLLQWFGVGITSKDGKVVLHSVSTAVIDPDGKLRAWYPTNEWTPQQAFKDVQKTLASDQQIDGVKESKQ